MVNETDGSIDLDNGEGSQHYDQFRLYSTRWFTIVKFINEKKSRSLMIDPSCFQSEDDYRALRFELNAMRPDSYAP
ncbi:MAG: hypothetical protein ACI8XW_001089 [Gammaproteobacteria bacterium]|jgi:hypothetical protein